MKTLKIFFVIMLTLTLALSTAYAAPGGNGNGRGPKEPKEKKPKTHEQANQNRSRAAEKGRKDALVRANLPEAANANAGRIGQGKKEEKAKADPRDVLKALENSRWSYNPNDERGQGNMGKPNMRDPFGHDKDSGRVGSERGRPVKDSNPEWQVNITYNMADYLLLYMQGQLAKYKASYEWYVARGADTPTSWGGTYAYWIDMYAARIAATENFINNYYSIYPFDHIAINRTSSIGYSLDFTLPEGFEGTNFIVTTSLINAYTYGSSVWGGDHLSTVTYNTEGQVIMQQTQEVALGANNTFSYTYNPPDNLVTFPGVYANLVVEVTEPVSGQSYAMTYDRQLYLYRCPYGKVTNRETGESIVGAKITVHFEDGSMVPLDKASNPTASNPQITDATGRYGFKLETNRKYYITAKAPGYEDYRSEIFTEKWHVLREDIAMTSLKTVALNAE